MRSRDYPRAWIRMRNTHLRMRNSRIWKNNTQGSSSCTESCYVTIALVNKFPRRRRRARRGQCPIQPPGSTIFSNFMVWAVLAYDYLCLKRKSKLWHTILKEQLPLARALGAQVIPLFIFTRIPGCYLTRPCWPGS